MSRAPDCAATGAARIPGAVSNSGDLSRFVEEAVRAHILELSAKETKAANTGVNEVDLGAMVNEALDRARSQ